MIKRTGIAVATMLALSGCDLVASGKNTSQAPDIPAVEAAGDVAGAATATVSRTLPDSVVARVNDQDVLASAGMNKLDDVIVMELLAQQAHQGVVDDETLGTIRADIEHLERQMLMEAYVSDFMAGVTVEEQDIQAYYDTWVAAQDLMQYSFTFARFDQRERAEAAIADIREGDAPDLSAFKHFKTAESDEDLEWASLDQLPPMFASILPTLDVQDTHDTPLPSNQGYFVIHLEDTRERELPELTEVSTEIEEALKREALRDHINETRKEAVIQIK